MKPKIFIAFAFILFLTPFMSAWEFDNSISYSDNDMTVDFENAFGLPLIGSHLGSVTLTSHTRVDEVITVYSGQEVVTLTYETNFPKGYQNGFGEVTFIDMYTGDKVNRNYYLAEKVPSVCTDAVYANGTDYISCTEVEWNRLPNNHIPAGKTEIGLIMEVQEGDWIDAVWKVAGKGIHKHAQFTEGEYIDAWDSSNGVTFATGICSNVSDVWIVDSTNDEVYHFYENGTFIDNFDTSVQTGDPQGCDVNATNIFITEREGDFNVIVYDMDGSLNTEFNAPVDAGTRGIAQNGTSLFIVNVVGDNVTETDMAGTFIRAWSTNASNDAPTGVAAQGDFVWVTDTTDDAVYKYYNNGTYTGTNWALNTSNNGPNGIGINHDQYNKFYIVDNEDSPDKVYIYGTGGDDESPTVTLVVPADAEANSSSTIDFNCSATSPTNNIANITLWHNASGTFEANETWDAGSDATEESHVFTQNFAEGTYLWNCQAYNVANNPAFATSNRTFSVDTSAPTITITSPLNQTISTIGGNQELNWSVVDSSPDTCWFDYNGTNQTVTCGDNNFTFGFEADNSNLTFYANDTIGNEASQFYEWNVDSIVTADGFLTNVSQTQTSIFNITFNTSSTPTGLFYYNLTAYSPTFTNTAGNEWTGSYSLNIPTNITGNTSFHWALNISSNVANYTTRSHIVNDLIFGLCNATLTDTFVNFTFTNETVALESETGTIDSSTFYYYLDSPTVNKTLTFSNSTENSEYSFCARPITDNINVQTNLDYNNGHSQQRSYDALLNLSSVTTNISLYLLPTSDGQFVAFQVLNAAQTSVSGATLTANRTIDGTSTLVEQGITDNSGVVSFWLNPNFQHQILVKASGFADFLYTVTPSETSYTITLGGNTTASPTIYNEGIFIDAFPENETLFNDTTYDFSININTSIYVIESMGFTLETRNGTILASNTSNQNGGAVNLSYNVGDNTEIYINPFYVINSTYLNESTKLFFVVNTEEYEYSISNFAENLRDYLDDGDGLFGLDNFSFGIIIFLVIFMFVGIMSFQFGLQSPAAISVLTAVLVVFFDMGLGLMPAFRSPGMVAGFPTIMIVIIAIALSIREFTR